MFEKEAEEYGKRISKGLTIEKGSNAEIALKSGILGFECGAEYGYNKAKEEWKKHFLQCSSPFCLDNFSEVKCYGELGNMAKKEGE